MIYVVVSHFNMDSIEKVFQSKDREKARDYLFTDFKNFCEKNHIQYLNRDNPNNKDDPYDYDGVYGHNKEWATASNMYVCCDWKIICIDENEV